MRILFVGDIVGSAGRKAIKALLPKIKKEYEIKFVIANGENVAGGSGLTEKTFEELITAGCNVITTGDHIWKNRGVMKIISHPALLRPANLSPKASGKGAGLYEIEGIKIMVINLIGRIFMNPAENPFITIDSILESTSPHTIICVDFHAEATSEKVALGWYLDGRVAAVVGTHTHVQTSDARILPGGTAYITDIGMTGGRYSIIGRKIQPVLHKFLTDMPAKFEVSEEEIVLEGAVVSIDTQNNKAQEIFSIRESI